jgi:hypothetical protein
MQEWQYSWTVPKMPFGDPFRFDVVLDALEHDDALSFQQILPCSRF